MTTPTTAQYNAWGAVCATLKTAETLEPSGLSSVLGQRVKQHVGNYIDGLAGEFGMSVTDMRDNIEASAGYTNTGGTGAICS
jgi:hypothetical protein